MRNRFPDNAFVPPQEGSSLRLAIGEAPGATEAEVGRPFAGGAGDVLNALYKNCGIKKDEVSIINVIQCRPPENAFPTDSKARTYISSTDAHAAVGHCVKAHVEPFLQSRPWVRIDLLGDKALSHIGEKESVTLWRGSPLPIPSLGPELRTVPTFHPAYLMRDQAMLPVAINDLRKPLVHEPENYNLYPSLGDVQAFRARKFAFDIETDGWSKNIRMVGLSAEDYGAIVVPFTEPYKAELVRIFAEAEEVIGQNLIQFDLPVLAHNGVTIRGPKECIVWDIMLMHHLRFPKFPHGLEFIGKQFTEKGNWKYDKASFETYCARDVDVTWRCFAPLKTLLEQTGLLENYLLVSWPLALICSHMTSRGFMKSSSRLGELREKYQAAIAAEQDNLPAELRTRTVTKKKRSLAPTGLLNEKGKPVKYLSTEYDVEEHPWRSSKNKLEYLYGVLKLPEQYHIKTKKPTVDKIALEGLFLKTKNPVVDSLRKLNSWATKLSGFAKETEEVNEVIHPSFNVHGTETGRLSSSGPNAQNIPEEARFMFVPRTPAGRIIAVDYSGIENRLVAYLAKDKWRLGNLSDPAFSEHKFLCSRLEGIPVEQVQKSKERTSWYMIAKSAVHGADRMMGAKKMWEKDNLDPKLTKDALHMWKTFIADTVRWQSRVADDAKRSGYVVNPFGRKLWFWESSSATQAISFLPQSSAADIIYRAMIGLMYDRIGWPLEWAQKVCKLCLPLPEGADLNLQVHDELVVETDNEAVVDDTIATIKKVMTQPWPEVGMTSFPVGVGVGESWGECN
jgi:uracil-DNA glycosylase family 4